MRTRAAQVLYQAGSVSFHFENGVVHRSGAEAPIYINVRVAFGNPETRQMLSELMHEYIESGVVEKPEVVLGVASGGQAPAQELANQLFLPFGFIRKEAKGYGEKKQVEGIIVTGKRILVVEDVVNRGTSSLPAVEVVRREGGHVNEVLAIVGYGRSADEFAKAGIWLKTLTTVADIVEVGVMQGALSREDADRVLAWLTSSE